MDILQRRVLHRKTFFLAENVKLTENLCKEAVRQGLIQQPDVAEILDQVDDYHKTVHFISCLVRDKGPVFDKFCYLLERTSYGDVADELQAEVAVDKEEKFPQYINRECNSLLDAPLSRTVKGRRVLNREELLGVLVRRFSAGKTIGTFQAKRRIEEINREKLSILDDMGKVEKVLDGILSLYGATAMELLKKSSKGGVTAVGDNEQHSLYFGPQGHVISYREKLGQLEQKAKCITESYKDLVDQHREYMKERSRCFYLLGFGSSPMPNREALKMKLDLELQHILASSLELDQKGKVDSVKATQDEQNSLQLQMDRKVSYLQKENLNLQEGLSRRNEEIHGLQRVIGEKSHFIRVQQEKMANLMKRCDILENTRRIGYFSEQINNKMTESDLKHSRELFEMEWERSRGIAASASRPSSACSQRSDGSLRSVASLPATPIAAGRHGSDGRGSRRRKPEMVLGIVDESLQKSAPDVTAGSQVSGRYADHQGYYRSRNSPTNTIRQRPEMFVQNGYHDDRRNFERNQYKEGQHGVSDGEITPTEEIPVKAMSPRPVNQRERQVTPTSPIYHGGMDKTYARPVSQRETQKISPAPKYQKDTHNVPDKPMFQRGYNKDAGNHGNRKVQYVKSKVTGQRN